MKRLHKLRNKCVSFLTLVIIFLITSCSQGVTASQTEYLIEPSGKLAFSTPANWKAIYFISNINSESFEVVFFIGLQEVYSCPYPCKKNVYFNLQEVTIERLANGDLKVELPLGSFQR